MTNFAMPRGHAYDPGYATRRVIVEDGIVYVSTIGEGIGPDPFNVEFATDGFLNTGWNSWSDIDKSILRDISDQGVPVLGGCEVTQIVLPGGFVLSADQLPDDYPLLTKRSPILPWRSW